MMYLTIIKGLVACINAGLACALGLCIILKDSARTDFAFWFATILFIINTIVIFTL